MANIKHVVVLMMENRSFDELFGMFPGVRGINDTSPAIPQPFTQPNGPVQEVYPYRMSTFTSTALLSPHFGHDWNSMHIAISSSVNAIKENQLDAAGDYNWVPPDAANPVDNCGFGAQPYQAIMGYYAADDVPYLWALAQNFVLCDNFFCSSLTGTGPNRLYLTGGTIDANPVSTINAYTITNENDPPILGNIQRGSGLAPVIPESQVPWGSYLSDLMKAINKGELPPDSTYKVYDDWQWLPEEISDCDSIDQAQGSPSAMDATLNTFWAYNDSLGVGGIQPSDLAGTSFGNTYKADPNYKETPNGPIAGLLQFEIDAQAGLPTLAWIHPPYLLSQWPPYTLPDGSYYISRIVDAVINSPDWESTVLIIVYDETGTHFDHVVPPLSPDPSQVAPGDPFEPWANDEGGTNDTPFVGAAPIGAGMRVPAIIVSPWTYQGGINSDLMDLTSILQCMETVTGVTCSHLPPNQPNSSTIGSGNLGWRRSQFANLHTVIDNFAASGLNAVLPSNSAIWASGFPTQATALIWRNNAWDRAKAPPKTGAPTNLTGIAPLSQTYSTDPSLFPKPPNPPVWPPVLQACAIIDVQTYTRAEIVSSESVLTFQNALSVAVTGFEPQEFVDPNAGIPGPNPSALYPGKLQSVPILNSNPPTNCITRIPSVVAVGHSDIIFNCTGISSDPNVPAAAMQPNSAEQGVPSTYIFQFSVTFQNPADVFPGIGPAIFMYWLDLQASFAVDTTVTADGLLFFIRPLPPWIFTKITEFGNILGSGGVVIDVQPGDPGSVLRAFSAPLRRDLIHIINQVDLDASDAITRFTELVLDAFNRHR